MKELCGDVTLGHDYYSPHGAVLILFECDKPAFSIYSVIYVQVKTPTLEKSCLFL